MTAKAYFQQLNRDYLAVAEPKEDLFWVTHMGTSDEHDAYAAAEKAYNHFVSNPARISELKAQIAAAESAGEDEALLHGLRGWLNFFQINAIEAEAARELEADLVQDDTDLFERRKAFTLHYTDERGEAVEASTNVLATNLISADDERVRKSSHEGLLALEQWVVGNGFVDMMKRRNAFARSGLSQLFRLQGHQGRADEPGAAVRDSRRVRGVDASRPAARLGRAGGQARRLRVASAQSALFHARRRGPASGSLPAVFPQPPALGGVLRQDGR